MRAASSPAALLTFSHKGGAVWKILQTGEAVSVLVIRSPDRKSYTLCSRMSLRGAHAERLLRLGKMGDFHTFGAVEIGHVYGGIAFLVSFLVSPLSYASRRPPKDGHCTAPCSALREGFMVFSTHPTKDRSIYHAGSRCQVLTDIGCVHFLESFRPFCRDGVVIPILQLRQRRLEDEMICPSPHGH